MEREDFETVVLNLLSNAFKYTPDDHTVTLQGHMGEDRNLIIAVKDTGIGIPQDQTELVFERYHNIHHVHAEYQLGLGLPLVKKIMTEYGGQVSLESVLGQGTTISLTFPPSLVLVEHHEIPTSSEEDSHLGKLYASEIRLEKSPCTQPRTASNVPTLLLVEDDADMSAYIVSILQDSYRIVCASNGKEGLKILDETAVDLIISDIMMPQMDGHEFLAAVQQRENPVPLMFLTARDSLEEHIASLKNGAIRYITKPFTPQVLLATIASLLDHDRKLMEHRVQRLRQGIDRLLSELQHPLSQHDGQTLQRRLATIAHHYSLTQREMDILRLMLQGSSDKEIAQRLRLSSRTVSNHNLAIYRKVAVAGRYELLSRLYQEISL
jgi:DNA-binding NarL/FixJ family response regulator/anti-sigma regulatory factor (Ser/Thr protein kinase)